MGSAIRIRCTNCDYFDDLWIGGGIWHARARHIENEFLEGLSEKEASIIIELKSSHNAVLIEGPRKDFYVCPKCNILSTNMYYIFSYDENKEYTKTYYCEKCIGELKHIPYEQDVNFSDFNCPKCGEKTLIDQGISINWN